MTASGMPSKVRTSEHMTRPVNECNICPSVSLTDTRAKCIHYDERIWYTWDCREGRSTEAWANCGPHVKPHDKHLDPPQKGCDVIIGTYDTKAEAFEELDATVLEYREDE